jgi:predicted PurR-regulated permease PerM
MRQTGGDPAYALLALASRLRRQGGRRSLVILLIIAAVAMVVIPLSVEILPWLG